MPSKHRDDVLQLMRDRVRVRWECYRRNTTYKSEYMRLFGRIITKEELSILNFEHVSETDTEEDFNRKIQQRQELDKSLDGFQVSEYDIEKINALPPRKQFYGNAYIVLFCRRWQIRYPKNPSENFVPSKDWSLFTDVFPVGSLPSIAEMRATAALDALKHIETWTTLHKMSLADAIQCEREDWESWKAYGERKREQSGLLILEIDTHFTKQEILAYLELYIDHFQRRVAKRTYRRWHKDWKMMFRAWDLRQEGHKHSDIATKIAEEFKMVDEPEDWKIFEWCQYAGEMVAEVEQFALSGDQLTG